VVSQAYDHVAWFRQRMQKHGLRPADIRGIHDIHRLPLTAQADLRDAYPFGTFALPMTQIVRLHVTGGSRGTPIVAAYSRHDLEVRTELIVRSLVSCGIRVGDIFQSACGHDLLADAAGLHRGAEKLGTTVVPLAGTDADQQIRALKDFGVSAICCAPSFFLHVLERAGKIGVEVRDLPLRSGIFLGEPWSEAVRQQIEELAGIKAYDMYGVAEILGLGVGVECCQQNGVHIFEDHFYPEIVDPATGLPLGDGCEGELVLTTLSREAMPLIRYRTGELTVLMAEPCPCGRTLRRIRRTGRPSDELVMIQGVPVFSAQIEAVLLAVEGRLPHYQIVLTQQSGVEQVELQVEVTPQVFSDRLGAMESLQDKLAHEIEQSLGISVPLRLVEPQTIQRRRGEVQRVVDKRSG
jgi:phenylacetate-CoA ligase